MFVANFWYFFLELQLLEIRLRDRSFQLQGGNNSEPVLLTYQSVDFTIHYVVQQTNYGDTAHFFDHCLSPLV